MPNSFWLPENVSELWNKHTKRAWTILLMLFSGGALHDPRFENIWFNTKLQIPFVYDANKVSVAPRNILKMIIKQFKMTLWFIVQHPHYLWGAGPRVQQRNALKRLITKQHRINKHAHTLMRMISEKTICREKHKFEIRHLTWCK